MVVWLLAACPLEIFEPVGALQAYRVSEGTSPLVPFVGPTLNCTPLHNTVLIGVMAGLGSI